MCDCKGQSILGLSYPSQIINVIKIGSGDYIIPGQSLIKIYITKNIYKRDLGDYFIPGPSFIE